MKTQKPSMTQFRQAKKATGLAPVEKHALVAIADACSMADGVCRKSVATMSKELGIKVRAFHYAVRGRQREDGTYYFPGLLARGIVTAIEREGVPTVYTIDQVRLDAYCEVTRAQDAPNLRTTEVEPVHKIGSTCAQNQDDLCTNQAEPVPNGIQVLTTVLRSNSKESATAVRTSNPALESKPKSKAQADEIEVQGRCSNCGALGSCDSDCPPCDECGEQICAHRFEAVELTDQERAWLAQRKANPQLFEELYQ